MTQETLVFLIGLILFITPFLGIPTDWKVYVYVGLAAVLLILGYRMRYARFLRSIETAPGERSTDVFTESDPTAAPSANSVTQ